MKYKNSTISFIVSNSQIEYLSAQKCTDIWVIDSAYYQYSDMSSFPTEQSHPHLKDGLRILYEDIITKKGEAIKNEVESLLRKYKYVIVRYADMDKFISNGCVFKA